MVDAFINDHLNIFPKEGDHRICKNIVAVACDHMPSVLNISVFGVRDRREKISDCLFGHHFALASANEMNRYN